VLYYDSYKFRESKAQDLTNGGVWTASVSQPDTEMTVYGARLAVGF